MAKRERKPSLRIVKKEPGFMPSLRDKQVDQVQQAIEKIAALETATELGVRNHMELDALIFQCRALLKARAKAV